MDRPIRWHDYLTLNINWFALTARSQILTTLLVPLLVQQFVGDAAKGSYVGSLRLWTLMAALLFQALFGMLSDHSQSKWGRRRPFIVGGMLLEMIVVLLIGLTIGMNGQAGYWMLFALMMVSMFGSNAYHAATQALIPDLVPDQKKGLFSGIKAMLELPVPLIFVALVVGPMVRGGNLWGGLIALVAVIALGLIVSLFIREQPVKVKLPALDWKPFLNLAGMTALFTALILGIGAVVRLISGLAQGMSGFSQILTLGSAGLIGMLTAVVLGVLLSVRVGLGPEAGKQGSYVWWVVNRLAFMVASTNLATFTLYFLQEKFPATLAGEAASGPAAFISLFVGVFILVVAIPSGALADRFGKKALIRLAGLLVAGGTAVVVIAPSLVVTYVGAAVIGMGVGLFYASSWALGTEIVPKEQAGRYLGIQNLAGAGAGAVGAYIGGSIADSGSYVLLMSLYGLMALLSILALRGVHSSQD